LIERQDAGAIAIACNPAIFLEQLVSDFETILVQRVVVVWYRDVSVFRRVIMKSSPEGPFKFPSFASFLVGLPVRIAGFARIDQRTLVQKRPELLILSVRILMI